MFIPNTVFSRLNAGSWINGGSPSWSFNYKLWSPLSILFSARMMFCAPKHCHIMPLHLQLHWLPIRLRIEFKILLFTFKVLQGSAPKYLIDLISVLPPSRYNLRRNNKGILLSTPKRFTKVTMGDRSFQEAAPRLWNSLPISIRSACTKSDFKQKLKTFLFSKAFILLVQLVYI